MKDLKSGKPIEIKWIPKCQPSKIPKLTEENESDYSEPSIFGFYERKSSIALHIVIEKERNRKVKRKLTSYCLLPWNSGRFGSRAS